MAPAAQNAENWSESINVAGVVVGGFGKVDMPKGIYKAKTVKSELTPKKDGSGAMNVRFTVEVVAPKVGAGNTVFKTMASPGNEKAKPFWKACLLSHGIAASALEKGDVKMGAKTFLGKTCFISFTPAVDEDGYYDVEFVTPDRYTAAPAGATTVANGKAGKNGNSADATGDETPSPSADEDDLL